ncbi:MAG: ABC transporter permease [Anaerolineae bacterium]|nr:ABC transporter permease [Anaerolineae bacterium]
MARYILRRFLISIPILLGVTIVTFTFINLVPGDYIDTLINPELSSTTRADLEPLRQQLGLDKPAPVRYVLWLRELAAGNLGFSLSTRKPVTEEIGRRLGPTLKITATSLLFAILVGTLLGILSAMRPYSVLDLILTILGFTWVSIPVFFAAMAALYLLALKLPLFPVAGTGPAGQSDVPLHIQLYYLVLPAGILGLERVAAFMRFTRASMLEVLRQDYISVARAKGLQEWRIIARHAFRNAVLPLITIIGLSLPGLIGGAVIIESIFGWPGLGTLSLTAVTQRDYPIIMGVNFIGAVLVLGSNLLADVAYALADPRIRYE